MAIHATWLSTVFAREDGQGLAEYALILALISIISIIALLFLGTQISTVLSIIGNTL
jgi:pilus assembly protein Flp/PilA